MPTRITAAALISLLAISACAELPAVPDGTPAFAKGGGKPAEITQVPALITLNAGDLLSDGNGVYVDQECGVSSNFLLRSDGSDGMQFYPAATPSSCSREAIVRIVGRHPSPDRDDHTLDGTAPLGSFYIEQIKLQLDGRVAVINAKLPAPGTSAATSCFSVDRRGRIGGGRGLRFDPATFAGSNSLEPAVQDPETGALHVRSSPWPRNLAGCENNDGLSYWHVDVDLTIAEK